MDNGNLPAAPCCELLDDDVIAQRVAHGGSDVGVIDHLGLTKREAFAMAAMEGDWASQCEAVGEFHDGMTDEQWDGRSELYVKAANALLRALEEAE